MALEMVSFHIIRMDLIAFNIDLCELLGIIAHDYWRFEGSLWLCVSHICSMSNVVRVNDVHGLSFAN